MNAKDKNKINQAINFVEEFSWLLKSNKNIKLEETASLLRALTEVNNDVSHSAKNNKTSNANKNTLVGILPFLFQDKELFPVNKDIIDFAENLFKINITRQDKRTRYELIGLIVTNIIDIKDETLNDVMEALSLITNDKEKLFLVKRKKKDINFSWNSVISSLNDNG